MDANGLRFWLLADAAHWPSRSHTAWHAECRMLRLAPSGGWPRRSIPRRSPLRSGAGARAARAWTCTTRSRAGTRRPARSSRAATCRRGGAAAAARAARATCASAPTACSTSRSPTACTCTTCAAAGPTRRCGSPASRRGGSRRTPAGLWVLERGRPPGAAHRAAAAGHHARSATTTPPGCSGPIPRTAGRRRCGCSTRWPGLRASGRLRSPRIRPAGSRCCRGSADGEAGCAGSTPNPDGSRRRSRSPMRATPMRSRGSMARTLAVRMPGRRDAPAFAVTGGREPRRLPLGEIYPLAADAPDAPFAHRLAGPPRYPLGAAGAEQLLPLSIGISPGAASSELCRHAARAAARISSTARAPHTVWHRLYAEASIPPGAGFVVWLAATDEAGPPRAGGRSPPGIRTGSAATSPALAPRRDGRRHVAARRLGARAFGAARPSGPRAVDAASAIGAACSRR